MDDDDFESLLDNLPENPVLSIKLVEAKTLNRILQPGEQVIYKNDVTTVYQIHHLVEYGPQKAFEVTLEGTTARPVIFLQDLQVIVSTEDEEE